MAEAAPQRRGRTFERQRRLVAQAAVYENEAWHPDVAGGAGRLDDNRCRIDHPCMWGIALINRAGEQIDQVDVDAPFETLRDWCRKVLEDRPEAVLARLQSSDGSFDYEYPEPSTAGPSATQ